MPKPITITVTPNDTGGGSTVTADVVDAGTPGRTKGLDAEIVFVCDAKNVKYKGATPIPFDTNNNSKSIEVRWRHTFPKKAKGTKKAKKFKVELDCKPGAEGATCYAWTVTTASSSPKAWNADIETYYHGSHCCPKRLKKKGKK